MATAVSPAVRVRDWGLHHRARVFILDGSKRRIARCGRRGGKTTAAAAIAVAAFGRGLRVLYAAPTADQLDSFWFEAKWALADLVGGGMLYKNETEHVIEAPATRQRLRAKTAWNSDTLRGDYADLLILDEWQLCDEDMWGRVGAPMLLDNDGDAVFLYTPPSLHSRSITKAHDPLHAAKMFKAAQQDLSGRWAAFSWASHDNPYISPEALGEIAADMTALAYRQEIMAEDVEDMPGALWTWGVIEAGRVIEAPELARSVIAIDPAGGSSAKSDETGIVRVGVGLCPCQGQEERHGFVLEDMSGRYSPDGWARRAVHSYELHGADRIVAEVNNGGEMVENTLRVVERGVSYRAVHASRGKQVRAEPIAALYEGRKVHHVGSFPELESQMCSWVPGMDSPDRMDALVWALTDLMLGSRGSPGVRFV